jgi:hypothetical protein
MTHEEFMNALLRPTFVWRMAKGMAHSTKPSQKKSAETRMARAEQEIDELVYERFHTIRREKNKS